MFHQQLTADGTKDAEGASLGQASPDESLRQKDPVAVISLESPAMDTDGVNPEWLSMKVSKPKG